ncbi:cytosine deaminase [Breoghania corrubedonensis]|uniref:Cytosine deaminase n=1 Tax=Breoghania corrubedonensis TaxID=665038 RepID=A0A2T5VHP9_9HYPH|nr:cytosine deaminase [Breoghania corrubedonensis]PTW63273.1 cytosine deaminase [Breoghania corrubedonensis]
MTEFAVLDGAESYLLANATVLPVLVEGAGLKPDDRGLARVDIRIDGATITRIDPSRPRNNALGADPATVVDLDAGMILPTLVDSHVHLDKGHIWPRHANADGTFPSALQTVSQDRIANWSAEDVRARMDFALRCAYAHGTSLIRTHIDSLPPQDEITWPVLCEVIEDWSDRLSLHGSCLFGIDRLDSDDGFLQRIANRIKATDGVLGAVTYMVPRLDEHLDTIMQAADERGLDLDFHVDETSSPDARSLARIAEAALRNRYSGNILCGHCCSLACQDEAEADRTMDLVARAGIAVVSLPMCNMYLQGRRNPGETPDTPRWRGITLLHELKRRGVRVMVASDNTRDPFYAYGDLDMVEVFTQATRIAHLDHPASDWIRSVTTTPADVLRHPDKGRLRVGGGADFIAFRGRDLFEIMARPSAPRDVFRNGRLIPRILPDYRELDALMGEVS